MALIQGTTSVGLIVGSAGASTYSRNRGGNYVKPRKSSANPNTSFQASIRAIVGGLPALWRSLSDSQRDGWNAQSPNFPYINKLGNTAYYSGYNLFCQANTNLQLIGRPTISDAFSPSDNGTIQLFEVNTLTNSSQKVHLECIGGWSNSRFIIFGSTQLSAGIGVVSKSTYKLINYYSGSNVVTIDITASFAARGLTAHAGSKNFFEACLINKNTGQASNKVICNAIAS